MEHTLSFAEDKAQSTFVAPYLVLAHRCYEPASPSIRLSIAEVERTIIGRGKRDEFVRSTESGRTQLWVQVADSWMSSKHCRIERRGSEYWLRDLGSKNGTFVGAERVSERRLFDGDVIEVGNVFIVVRLTVTRTALEAVDISLTPATGDYSTLNPELARSVVFAKKQARGGGSVVIRGETGSGKEVLARALHVASGRRGEFVAVNCGAIAPSLIESELFGHKKGAFSGALSDRLGLIRSAEGGTLFLDEIGDLPADAQVKFLRVLEERMVTPVGDARPIDVDFLLLSATHGDLPALVAGGEFRQDLYARIRGAEIVLPPLREHREDLGLLLSGLLSELGKTLTRAAARLLFHHPWPSNVRELVQVLRSAALSAEGDSIDASDLRLAGDGAPARTDDADEELRKTLVGALERHRGNVSQVARDIGKARVQVRRWCKRLGIEIDEYRAR